MSVNIEGGCLCGQVRYSLSAEPFLTAVCHCRHCQKQGGSAYSVVSAYPEAAFTQTGTTRIFADVGDSGQSVARHFCPDCGSPIISVAAALPGVVIVKAGTLDGFADTAPTMEAYCDNRLSWLPALDGAEQFPGSNI
jgi:hypothetical protein